MPLEVESSSSSAEYASNHRKHRAGDVKNECRLAPERFATSVFHVFHARSLAGLQELRRESVLGRATWR